MTTTYIAGRGLCNPDGSRTTPDPVDVVQCAACGLIYDTTKPEEVRLHEYTCSMSVAAAVEDAKRAAFVWPHGGIGFDTVVIEKPRGDAGLLGSDYTSGPHEEFFDFPLEGCACENCRTLRVIIADEADAAEEDPTDRETDAAVIERDAELMGDAYERPEFPFGEFDNGKHWRENGTEAIVRDWPADAGRCGDPDDRPMTPAEIAAIQREQAILDGDIGELPVRRLAAIEGQIVKQVIVDVLAAGYALSVFDGEEYTIQRSRDAAGVFAAMHQTDEDVLYCHDGGPSSRWVHFVYGNDGWDVIADYSVFLEDVLQPAEALADRLAE
jgi:hypothetical protein